MLSVQNSTLSSVKNKPSNQSNTSSALPASLNGLHSQADSFSATVDLAPVAALLYYSNIRKTIVLVMEGKGNES